MKLSYSHHENIDVDKIICKHKSCKNVNAKKKEYCNCKGSPFDDLKYIYSQLLFYKDPYIKITTPEMICPFGISNQGSNFNMCLQFTNYSEDIYMKSFYEFIERIEFKQMELLGLTSDNSDLFISQIKHDKNNKYDPNLQVKIPFSYNKFACDIFSDEYSGINIMNINKFSKLQCDIYLDKIWKYNEKFVSKWKVNKIKLL
jgi:hypothetical protein